MALRKLEDVIIYRDDNWYSTFPSLVTRPDGKVLCAFRRAPDRRRWGGDPTHADPNSWCMMVSSGDDGRTWDAEPDVVFASPLAGNQDPCLFQLADDTILCSTFSWMLLPASTMDSEHALHAGMGWVMANVGACLARSVDGGDTWATQDPFAPGVDAGNSSVVPADGRPQPIVPPPWMPAEKFPGVPNRGACRGKMAQLPDGRVLWPVYSFRAPGEPADSSVYISADKGLTWRPLATIAQDDKVELNETSLHVCPSGKVIAWMRTGGLDGFLATAYSTDGGETWSPWERTSVWGHPFTSCETADGRVALIYGYRREPFGIRVRLLEPECSDLEQAEELVLRDDGANTDIGYPWVTPTQDGNLLCAYYINTDGGTRYIAGSIVAVD